MDNYEQVFGELPKKEQSPIDKDDHSEIDTTEELGPEETAIFQSFIGCLQWAVTLGRIDIMIATTMTLSRFRPAPQRGHLQRVKRILGYLRKFPHGAIRIRVDGWLLAVTGIIPPRGCSFRRRRSFTSFFLSAATRRGGRRTG